MLGPTLFGVQTSERGAARIGFTHAWVEICALRKICRDHDRTRTRSALWERSGGDGRDEVCNFDTLARFLRETLAGTCASTKLTQRSLLESQ